MPTNTDPFGSDGVFKLGEEYRKPSLPEETMLPFAHNRRAWDQYTNPFVYEFDSLIRQWIKLMSENSTWTHRTLSRRYTMSMVWEQVYGRQYDNKADGKYRNQAAKILAYYSTRIQKGSSINGKKYSKTIYTISPRRLEKPPYSLRLRLEWLADKGKVPTISNMRLPQDKLKPGHARNKVSEEKMQRRSEDGRQRYESRKEGL